MTVKTAPPGNQGEGIIVRSNLVARLMATACIAGSAAPATAQSGGLDGSATAETNGLGDIVVTAQKREERLQDVPIAISAIAADFLQSRDISSIDQLGTIAPNVKIERSPTNKTVSQIAMRGSVTVNPSVLFERAVGLYVDGVYIAKAQGSIFDIADLSCADLHFSRLRAGMCALSPRYGRIRPESLEGCAMSDENNLGKIAYAGATTAAKAWEEIRYSPGARPDGPIARCCPIL